MRPARWTACVAVVAAAGALAGCESTVEKAEKASREGSKAFHEQGLRITAESRSAEVVSSTVLHDANGAAVAVEVRNTGPKPLTEVPIAVSVLDAGGRVVFRNDTAGLQQSLRSVALIEPGRTALWVNDQVVSAGGEPAKVEAKLGATPAGEPSSAAFLPVAGVKLVGDEVDGLSAEGFVTNDTAVDQRNVVVSAVARRGSKIVAAGRGIVPELKQGARARFQVFFIGNPRGGKLDVSAPPTTLTRER